MNMDKNCIVICGPTASGKTRLAVEIARKVGGEILSADSRQVYRGMDVGTGKDLYEYGERGSGGFVPYHLIDIVDPPQIYTLYDYQQDFYRAFDDVRDRGRVPVIAGGSGLYIEAVLKGYALPPVPENAAFRKSMMGESRETLLETLRDEHPQVFAKTDVSTKKRIVRALEVAKFGRLESFIDDKTSAPQINPLIIYVVWERPELRARIEKRLRERLEQGLIDEVAGLMDSGIDPERFALFGMEYKHVARYVNKEVGYDEMTAQLLQDIYHLAKRQDTWFRGMERRGMTVCRAPRGEYLFSTIPVRPIPSAPARALKKREKPQKTIDTQMFL
jgi:tRNA dimethylallyltransferase